jgi:hypothetical protein
MDSKKIITLAISLAFLLTVVSAYSPPDYPTFDPDITIDPDLMVTFCSCNPDWGTESCTTSGGCAGTHTCTAASCTIRNSGCADETCELTYDTCNSLCSFSSSMCYAACMSQTCRNNCEDSYDSCVEGCEEDFDVCDACTGRWSTCEKVNPCCDVMCLVNEECDGGVCVCSDTEERCGADGTGDGIDNDCDGDVDEGCDDCVSGTTQACTEDSCPGQQTCISGEWTECEKFNPCCGVDCPSTKICDATSGTCVCKDSVERCGADGTGDGIDNDCDGDVDEGCSATPTIPPADAEEGEDGSDEEGSEGSGTGGSEGTGDDSGTPLETGTDTSGSETGSMQEADIPISSQVLACHDQNGICVEQCVGCAPEYLDVCAEGYEISGICKAQTPGVLGGNRYVCCVPEGQTPAGQQDDGQTSNILNPSQDQGVDMDLVMILVIVIVVGVIVIVAIAVLKRRPKMIAPIAPQPPTPPVQ